MDTKISIGIIGSILLQTLVLGWWTSKLDSRVGNLEVNDQKNEISTQVRAKVIDDKFSRLDADRDRLIRLETDTTYIREALRRIEGKLDPKSTN